MEVSRAPELKSVSQFDVAFQLTRCSRLSLLPEFPITEIRWQQQESGGPQ